MHLFTIDHANRMLPLVRRIVEDVVREHAAWQDALVELDLVSSAAASDPGVERITKLERKIQSIARDIDAFQDELESLGIQLKSRSEGLIDFPSELDGRPMLLCWKLGEPSVQFWHDVDSGFAGRKPLSPSFVG